MLIYISRSKVPYHKLFILLPSKFAWASPEGMNRRMLFLSFFFSFFFLSSFHSCFISFVLLSLFCFILLPATVLGHSPYFSDPTHARPPSLVWEKKRNEKNSIFVAFVFCFWSNIATEPCFEKKGEMKKKVAFVTLYFWSYNLFFHWPLFWKKRNEKKKLFCHLCNLAF